MVGFDGYRRRGEEFGVSAKYRGNYSLFDGYWDESLTNKRYRLHTKHSNSQPMTSSSRVKTQGFMDPPDYNLGRRSSKKSGGPGLVARLMGLDTLPGHKPNYQDRPSEIFKDVYEVSDIRRSPIRNKFTSRSYRFSDHSEKADRFEDPFLKLLHEPSSLFIKHVEDHIVVLKSTDLDQSDNLHSSRIDRRSRHWYTEEERRLHLPSRDWNLKPSLDEIVVLEPGLVGSFQEARMRDSRERKKLSIEKSSRGIAREISDQMIRRDGEEARKQILERWKTAQRSSEGRERRRRSGTTLAEMLSLSKREVRSSGLERERRSSFHECNYLGPVTTVEDSFFRGDEKKKKKKKLPRVEVKPKIKESGPFSECKKMEKGVLFGVDEVEEHPSPVSVLEPPDGSVSSLDQFERVKVVQETKPGHQVQPKTKKNTEAEEIRLTFEDEDNLEFCYLLDILIDSGLYKVNRDMLLQAGFEPGSPVDPDVFQNLETIYSHLPWPGMNRKLMFDLVNSILAEIVDSQTRGSKGLVNKLLVQEVWETLIRRSMAQDASQLSLREVDEMTWTERTDDVDGIGAEIENVINDEILEELVAEICVF